jgi:integrase
VRLSKAAMVILREQSGKHPVSVFTYQGKPVVQTNTKAWRCALKRAGIAYFRWHDLRHTWASWHVQAGTPLHALQELGGWESVEMVRRYAHLSSEHLSGYVDRLSALHVVGEESDSYDFATGNKKGLGQMT